MWDFNDLQYVNSLLYWKAIIYYIYYIFYGKLLQPDRVCEPFFWYFTGLVKERVDFWTPYSAKYRRILN